MNSRILPSLWLLVFIVGLPQFSETVYTPALPDIARELNISDSLAEYTLTIYLIGFAVGTFLWGRTSDRWGRRPCVLIGLLIYIIGCMGCFLADSIFFLMVSRFIQAFGGSTGSVLGQAICRDVFHGSERGKVYSIVGTALSFSPAIGPVIGGIIDQVFGWSLIFLFLMGLGFFVISATYFNLPETYFPSHSSRVSIFHIAVRMVKDVRVLTFGLIVAGCNGIAFSYYAEGPFYLIELLGMSPSVYGFTFIILAFFGMTGGYISKRLHEKSSSLTILQKGLWTIVIGSFIFLGGISIFSTLSTSSEGIVFFTLGSMGIIFMGIGITIPNALSLALEAYTQSIGTASSLFGCYYYIIISLITFGMGTLHNDTIFPMPVYFFCIGLVMTISFSRVILKRRLL